MKTSTQNIFGLQNKKNTIIVRLGFERYCKNLRYFLPTIFDILHLLVIAAKYFATQLNILQTFFNFYYTNSAANFHTKFFSLRFLCYEIIRIAVPMFSRENIFFSKSYVSELRFVHMVNFVCLIFH